MSRSLVIQVDALVGEGVQDVAKDMVKLASGLNCSVSTDFNGVQLTAKPHTVPAALVDIYHAVLARDESGSSDLERNERDEARKLLKEVLIYWRSRSKGKDWKDVILHQANGFIRAAIYLSPEVELLERVVSFWTSPLTVTEFVDIINDIKNVLNMKICARSKGNSDENRAALQSVVESITHPEIMGSKVDPASLRSWVHELVDTVIDEAIVNLKESQQPTY